MDKIEQAYLKVIKEDAEGDLQEMWNLKHEGEELSGEWEYPANRPQPGEAFPNEDQIWKERIEMDKKICKWNQEHGRCLNRGCVFAWCRDDGYGIWDCDLVDNAAIYNRYEKQRGPKK